MWSQLRASATEVTICDWLGSNWEYAVTEHGDYWAKSIGENNVYNMENNDCYVDIVIIMIMIIIIIMMMVSNTATINTTTITTTTTTTNNNYISSNNNNKYLAI